MADRPSRAPTHVHRPRENAVRMSARQANVKPKPVTLKAPPWEKDKADA